MKAFDLNFVFQVISIITLSPNDSLLLFQDIVAKLLSLSQQRPRALCILSGTGTVSSVTLRQPASTNASITFEVKAQIKDPKLVLMVY